MSTRHTSLFPSPTYASFTPQHYRLVTFFKQKLCLCAQPICGSPALRLLWIHKKDTVVESTEEGQGHSCPSYHQPPRWTQLLVFLDRGEAESSGWAVVMMVGVKGC